MNIRYTDLCKQIQKTTAVLLSSAVILQSCSSEIANHRGNGGNSVEVSTGEVSTGRPSFRGTEHEFGEKTGDGNSTKSSWIAIFCAALAGFVVGAVPFGVGFGVKWGDANRDLNNANDQNAALQARVAAMNATNFQLGGQVSALGTQVDTLLGPSSAVMADINEIAGALNVTLPTSTTGRLLSEQGQGPARSLSSSNNLDVSALGRVLGISIPGGPIHPYTPIGDYVLKTVDAVLVATPAAAPADITDALSVALSQSNPATIAAVAAATVTYGTAGTPGAITTAMQAVLSAAELATDPCYLAAISASSKSGATMQTVLVAASKAGALSSPSFIAANAAAGITKASSFSTYPYSAMGPSPLAIATAVSATIGATAAEIAAVNAVAAMTETATPAIILDAINSALGKTNKWAQYGFLVDPTTNAKCIAGLVKSYGVTSIAASIASAMDAAGEMSLANSPYAFNVDNLLSAINIKTGKTDGTWATYIATSAAAPTASSTYADVQTLISAVTGGTYTSNATSVISGMSTSNALLASTVQTAVTASNPISIAASQASLVGGATGATVRNALSEAVSQSQAAYIEPMPIDSYRLNKLMEYVSYFPNVETISVTGQTLASHSPWDMSGLSKLKAVNFNETIVDQIIILSKVLSKLDIINSTMCAGGMIISDGPGANFTNPGFTNTTVNTVATVFNMQNGTGPLCVGNVGSLRKSGSLSIVSKYYELYRAATEGLASANAQMAGLKEEAYNAIAGNINATNFFLNATEALRELNNSVHGCYSAMEPYVSNPTTLAYIKATSCSKVA